MSASYFFRFPFVLTVICLLSAGALAQERAAAGGPEIQVDPTSLTVVEPGTRMWTPPPGYLELPETLDEHMPGRLIVAFHEHVVVDARSLSTSDPEIDALSRRVDLRSMRRLIETTPLTAARHAAAGLDRIYVLEFPVVRDVRDLVVAYRSVPGVRIAEPDYILELDHADPPDGPRLVPDDPLYPLQWAHNNTGQAMPHSGGSPVGTPGADANSELGWEISTGASNIIVAILDQGLDLNHPEFAGRVVPGYDFVNNNPNPQSLPNQAHGTATTGVAAAEGNNGIGVAGVAWGVSVMPLKVCEGGCPQSATIPAVIHAADNGARVINMSFGGTSPSEAFETAVDYAHGAGVALFASRGNVNTSQIRFPSGYANTIAVGALSPCNTRKTPTSCDGETWWGSSFGSGMDFLAPGTRIHTTDNMGSAGYSPGDYHDTYNGTSAAAPFASGIGALIFSVNPDLTPDEVRAIMQSTATDMGTPGYNDDTGFGRVNIGAALQATPGGGIFTVTNIGSGTLEVSSIAGDQTWLSVTPMAPFNLGAGESQEVEVVVDWNQLDETQSGTLTVSSNDTGQPTVAVEITAIPNLEPPEAVFTPSIEDGITATAEPGGTTTRTLNIANAGEHELEFDFTEYVDGGRGLMVRNDHLPLLDEALGVATFTIQPNATHTTTAQGGVETQGQVVGFTFEGTVSGISGVGTWASDMSMTITSPGGQSYQVGGFSSGYPAWDFQGSGSTNDGTYTSTHIGVFNNALDAGEWTFMFEHHWGSGVEMTWSDVTVTLHKSGLPFVTDISPASGTIAGGSSVDVTLTFDADDLDVGTHHGGVSIQTNEPGIGLRDYPVTLIVDGDPPDPPQAQVTPDELVFHLAAGETGNEMITVANVASPGASDLEYSVTIVPQSARPWMIGDLHFAEGMARSRDSRGASVPEFALDGSRLDQDIVTGIERSYHGDIVRHPSAAGMTAGTAGLKGMPGRSTMLYESGPLVNCPGCSNGFDASRLQTTTLNMNSLGFNHSLSGDGPHFRMADSFIVPEGGWHIETVQFFAYETGSDQSSSFTSVNLRIWDGMPGEAGSTVVYGDLETNRMIETGWTEIYRDSQTNPDLTNRPIMVQTVLVETTLEPGEYWFDWQSDGTVNSGPWAPPITIEGVCETGSARQLAAAGWQAVTDSGDDACPQGLPFRIFGQGGDLSVSPSSGSVAAGSSTQLMVTANATTAGTHEYNVVIETNDPDNPVFTVSVTVTVEEAEPPIATVDPEELYFVLGPDATASLEVTLSNDATSGADDLDYEISITAARLVSSDGQVVAGRDDIGAVEAMLSVEPLAGSIAAGSSEDLTVTVDTDGMDDGTYELEIHIATNDPDNPTLVVAVEVVVDAISAGDGAEALVFALEQNYPNPFASHTTIEYSTAEPGPVTITVYDMAGREVATLVNAEMEAGMHSVTWDANGMASGLYFYRIQAGAFSQTIRALVVR